MTKITPESLTSESEKAGLPPGALVHVGEILDTDTRILVVNYNQQKYAEHYVQSIDEVLPYRQENTVTWVNIEGLRAIDLIEAIGQHFDIHPLALEDILNTHQRPKFEDHENYLFIVVKALLLGDATFSVNYEQISVVVMNNLVFTFKEKQDELFDALRHRINNSKGRFRSLGADYLAYAIMDTIVDQYMSISDSLVDAIESVESELLDSPTEKTLSSIQQIKRELIFIRKTVSPVRELLAGMQRNESTLIEEKTQIYIRDVHDHAIRVIESIDSYRELVTGLLDIYLSSVSNKMNETMKVLTVFASIFIPLTFIVGIYGMNFEFMPELKWKWAYPVLWVVFVIISGLLLVFFRKKKWL